MGLIGVAAISNLSYGQQLIPIRMPGWRLTIAVGGSIIFVSSLVILLLGSVSDKEVLTIDIRLGGTDAKKAIVTIAP